MHYDIHSREGRSVSNEVDARYRPKVPLPERLPVPRDLWERREKSDNTYRAYRRLWFSIGQACKYLECHTPDECTEQRNKMLAILREQYTLCETRWQAEQKTRDELNEQVGQFDSSPKVTEQWK